MQLQEAILNFKKNLAKKTIKLTKINENKKEKFMKRVLSEN